MAEKKDQKIVASVNVLNSVLLGYFHREKQIVIRKVKLSLIVKKMSLNFLMMS